MFLFRVLPCSCGEQQSGLGWPGDDGVSSGGPFLCVSFMYPSAFHASSRAPGTDHGR